MRLQRIIGQRIRAAREERGMSQEQLAQRMGSHRPLVSRLETGRVEPTLGFLRMATGALGITLAEVLAGIEEQLSEHEEPAETLYARRVRGLLYTVARTSARGWTEGTSEVRACVVEVIPKAMGRAAVPVSSVTVRVVDREVQNADRLDLPPEVLEGVRKLLLRGRVSRAA